jgi:GDP-L-fucose synthase
MDTRRAPNAPYGIAKKALLVQCQAYRRQYGMNAIYLMPATLYGPGDHADLHSSHVIPALIRKFLEAKQNGAETVVCWGDGSATREFLFVDEAARGLALAAQHYDGIEPVNLGSGEEISIRDLAEMTARFCEYEGRIAWDTAQPNGQPRRRLDTTRAEQCFGFRAQISLEDGLARTVAWYRNEMACRKAAVRRA